MAFVIAKNSNSAVGVVDAAAAEQDLTSNWVTGGPQLSVNSVDVTTIADNGVKRKIGLQDHSWSMTFLYDNAANKSWAVFKARWAEDTPRNVVFYPEGNTTGKPRITISALVTGLNPGISVGDKLGLEASFESDGVATIDTVP